MLLLLAACGSPSPDEAPAAAPPTPAADAPPASSSAPPAAPAPPPPEGTLLWISEAAGRPQTVAQAFGDAEPHPVADLPGATFPADPDPSGRRALLVTSEDGPKGHVESLWAVALAGGAPLKLASSQILRNPEWSRDGELVTFESNRQSFRDLFRAAVDGQQAPVRLTDAPNGSFEPALSFDGRTLAFGTSRDGNAEIWTSAADGTGQERVTDHPADDVHPAWLPDGRLSWISHREGQPRVWVRDADGDQHPLRQEERAAADLDVAWSSLGVGAVVVQTGPKTVELQLRSGHGGLLATLDGDGPDEQPSWSPDGRWLAFTSSRSGSPNVWIASADGAVVRQVSRCTAPCWLPRWVATPAPKEPGSAERTPR